MRSRTSRSIQVSLIGVLIFANCLLPFVFSKLSTSLGLTIAWSGMITAIHESLCSLLAALMLLSALKQERKPWVLYLAISLFLVAFADLAYGVMLYIVRIPPPRGNYPLIHEIPYALFSGALAVCAVTRSLERTGNLARFALGFIIGAIGIIYFACSYRLILLPFFHQAVIRPWTIHATATFYAVFQSIAVGGLVVASLRAVSWSEYTLWFMLMTLTASDFVLRYQDMGHPIDGLSFSEYGWEFALAVVASLFFYLRSVRKDRFQKFIASPAPLFSLRVLTASVSLAGLLLFVVANWYASSYLKIVNAGTVGSYVFAFTAIWSISNGVSIILSQSLQGLNSQLLKHGEHVVEELHPMAWEVNLLFTFLNERNKELIREKDTVMRITSNVAHNIRTPLTALRAAIPRLESGLGKDCSCRSRNQVALESLTVSMKAIECTASDLLAERRKMLHAETINNSAQSAVNLVSLTYPKKNFELSNNTRSSTIRVPGLTPVLLNLLSNAAEATSTDSPIRIQISRATNNVEIEITDSGDGMPAEHLENIEQENPFTTKPTGNGLGVTSAMQWARENGYGLKFESQVGVGTRARLEIPC